MPIVYDNCNVPTIIPQYCSLAKQNNENAFFAEMRYLFKFKMPNSVKVSTGCIVLFTTTARSREYFDSTVVLGQ